MLATLRGGNPSAMACKGMMRRTEARIDARAWWMDAPSMAQRENELPVRGVHRRDRQAVAAPEQQHVRKLARSVHISRAAQGSSCSSMAFTVEPVPTPSTMPSSRKARAAAPTCRFNCCASVMRFELEFTGFENDCARLRGHR